MKESESILTRDRSGSKQASSKGIAIPSASRATHIFVRGKDLGARSPGPACDRSQEIPLVTEDMPGMARLDPAGPGRKSILRSGTFEKHVSGPPAYVKSLQLVA